MKRPRRALAPLAALLLLAGSCRPDQPARDPPPLGPHSSARVMTRLCRRPPAPTPRVERRQHVPAVVARVASEVEAVRGLQFTEPLVADAVSHRELVRRLLSFFDHSYPRGLLARRTRVWQTIGAIPPGIGIREAILRFGSTQVSGFYDPESGMLVYAGSENPSEQERLTLAHELIHALDDQNFDLDRLNAMEDRCEDEALAAGVAAVEGSAVVFSYEVAARLPPAPGEETGEGQPPPTSVPPFIQQLQLWPYLAGSEFIRTLLNEGGLHAVNRALRRLPASTEQIIHPERYGTDAPQGVGVSDLGPRLGEGWQDLDVMQVGEEWLSLLLALRLDQEAATVAAAGWDGGLYRAWSKGDREAIVLSTVWDSREEAAEFAGATGTWVGESQAARVLVEGERVIVLFGSDRAALEGLVRALS